MPDYSKGKVYTIRFHNSNDIYIGSTIQSLAKRLGGHKIKDRTINKLIEEKYNNDWSNCYIELYENYACNNKEELCKKEGEIIRLFKNDINYNCINMRISGRTGKEYYEENLDKIREYREKNIEKFKEYREKNIEKFKEYRNEYYQQNKEKINEYREENKDKIKEREKKYREENKDKILDKLKEKFQCDCGGCYIYSHKSQHFKTKKHQNYLSKVSIPEENLT